MPMARIASRAGPPAAARSRAAPPFPAAREPPQARHRTRIGVTPVMDDAPEVENETVICVRRGGEAGQMLQFVLRLNSSARVRSRPASGRSRRRGALRPTRPSSAARAPARHRRRRCRVARATRRLETSASASAPVNTPPPPISVSRPRASRCARASIAVEVRNSGARRAAGLLRMQASAARRARDRGVGDDQTLDYPAPMHVSTRAAKASLREIGRDLDQQRRTAGHGGRDRCEDRAQPRLALQVPRARGVRGGDIHHDVIGVRGDGGDQMRVVALGSAASLLMPTLAPSAPRRGRTVAIRPHEGVETGVVEAHAVDHRAASASSRNRRGSRIAGLRPRRNGAGLDEAETEPHQGADRHGVLVEARRQPDRVRKAAPSASTSAAPGRHSGRGGPPARGSRRQARPMRPLGIDAAQQRHQRDLRGAGNIMRVARCRRRPGKKGPGALRRRPTNDIAPHVRRTLSGDVLPFGAAPAHLCGPAGRPPGLKDGPCLVRLTGMGLARERADRRFEITSTGIERHERTSAPRAAARDQPERGGEHLPAGVRDAHHPRPVGAGQHHHVAARQHVRRSAK